MLSWLPVMTYRNSCLVQTFTWIITAVILFIFLSVVRRQAVWGRQELHHCLPSPCLDYTKAVCGPDPRWDWWWNYCQRCEQHQYHLPWYEQVPHHYLGDLRTRIPYVWAVKKPATLAEWWTLLSTAPWVYTDVTDADVTLCPFVFALH